MTWDHWLSRAWPELISGKRVDVPDWLPPPDWGGMQRTENAWVRSFDDGLTLVVTQAAPNGSKLVAEVRMPTRLDAAFRKAKEWASEHPITAVLVGGVLVVAVVALVVGIARAARPQNIEPVSDGRGPRSLPAPKPAAQRTARTASCAGADTAREAISALFAELLASIQPTDADIGRAQSHANSIEAALRESFSVNRLLIVGSHSRGTPVRVSSDVDYFAVVARDDVRWGDDYTGSETVLKNVRTALQDKFKSTEVRKDLQAVVVKFGDGEDPVDVVPAVFLGMSSNSRPLYRIPNGKGGWLETSPDGHNKYIHDADKRSGRKLRGTAQLLKYWRNCRAAAVPIQSFHLELHLAAAGVCRVGMTYAECIAAALERFHVTGCQPIADPLGISGEVPACSTDAKRLAALEAIRSGLGFATDAMASERAGDLVAARCTWRRFFNRAFPA
jgi:hypothetical protein